MTERAQNLAYSNHIFYKTAQYCTRNSMLIYFLIYLSRNLISKNSISQILY
jgi:hypothetical protein